MQLKTAGLLVLAAATFAGCDQNRVQVTETGLKYQLHTETEGARKAKVGDIVTLHLALKNAKDSVLRDTHKEGTPLQIMLQVPPFKGAFEEGLAMLSKGDSATFFVSADSLFGRAAQPFPPGIVKGSDIAFNVKVLDIQNEQEFQKTRTESMQKQKGTDETIIKNYLAKNGLTGKYQRTANGVYYTITQPGAGPKVQSGNMVKVNYTGKLLDGKVFDTSLRAGGKPVDFQVGVGMIIPGWEDGVMQLPKGSKGTLIIPSGMAYGPAGSPPAIPANSVLIFDIDVLDITKAPARPAMPEGPMPSAAPQR